MNKKASNKITALDLKKPEYFFNRHKQKMKAFLCLSAFGFYVSLAPI